MLQASQLGREESPVTWKWCLSVALVLTSSCSMYFAILACIVNDLFVLYPDSAVFKITTTGILDIKVILTLLPVFENTKVIIEFCTECLLT